VAALARSAGAPADVHADASEAYEAARAAAGPEGALLVCGTLYLLARLAMLEASG
jgi:folylpolyglutamate synthase/dihydropteroate synthase